MASIEDLEKLQDDKFKHYRWAVLACMAMGQFCIVSIS